MLALAILLLAGFTGLTFLQQARTLRRTAPRQAPPLPPNLSASAEEWTWEKREGGRTQVAVRAKTFQQVKEPSSFLLEGLVMRLYHKKEDGKYDLVRSARASFDTSTGILYSDGEVEITMGLPAGEDQPAGRLVNIRTSGVTFDTKTTRASTGRHAEFDLDTGGGSATGVNYDAVSRELHLVKEAKLDWKGRDPGAKPMRVEGESLIYREAAHEVFLFPSARLIREKLTLDTREATVRLSNGAIEYVEAQQARGRDEYPHRKLDFSCRILRMWVTPKGEIERIEAEQDAGVTQTSPAAITAMTAGRMHLFFASGKQGNELTRAEGFGNTRLEARPAARPGVAPPETRVLSAETVELKMRPGGEEIQQALTHTPGTIEFLPNRPGQRKRWMSAERMTMDYAPRNVPESFRAVTVKTRTESDVRGKPQMTLTASRDLLAGFEPKTGQMEWIEQWNDFTYEQGARRAQAGKARLDQKSERITLTDAARMWDETGSTSADEIAVDQKTGDLAAKGNVASSRVPDRKAAQGGMLSGDEPVQARAPLMWVSDDNRKVRYEGGALLWQGASRIGAERISIDRAAGRLGASGNVVSQFPDAAQGGPKAKSNAFTVVRAQEMEYLDKTKIAWYRGGATLERANMTVRSRELRAFFREEKSAQKTETKLDRMLAEGRVEVVDKVPNRVRRGSAERGEYFLGEEKMVLSGGNPALEDSQRGVTRGAVITWFARQDRLFVDNTGGGPAVTRSLKQ